VDRLISEGHPLITGAVSSVMFTVKLQVVVLPAASTAVYVTVVAPSGKISPELCVEVNETTWQLSEAVGAIQITS
jgi:hypothetical protein